MGVRAEGISEIAKVDRNRGIILNWQRKWWESDCEYLLFRADQRGHVHYSIIGREDSPLFYKIVD